MHILVMFSIKGRHYKVEHEGLHILCLSCGRFGHHAEVCGEKKEILMVEEGVTKLVTKGDIR